MELGGRAEVSHVLRLVEKKMQGVLNEYDVRPLPSDSQDPPLAQHGRVVSNTMVREGLLSSDSPWGIWEITEQGRKALQQGGV
ncbi:hypothetical protein HRbin10_02557 [bacterium HR10]|nr:hypothetical protein HRbin10_02557 [bacterium HR10]